MPRRIREVMFQSRHWQSLKDGPKDSYWARPEAQKSYQVLHDLVAERVEARQRDQRRIAEFQVRGAQHG